MTRLTLFLGALLLTSGVFATSALPTSKTVLISQVALHPALDITVKGIIDALEKKALSKVKTSIYGLNQLKALLPLRHKLPLNFCLKNRMLS